MATTTAPDQPLSAVGRAPIPRQVATVYRVDDKTLYLGGIVTNSVPANKRPATLDRADPYTTK